MRKPFLLLIYALFSTVTIYCGTVVVTPGDYNSVQATDTINAQVESIANDLNNDGVIQLSGNQHNFAKSANHSNAGLINNGVLYSGFNASLGSISLGLIGLSSEKPWALGKLEDSFKNGNDKDTGIAINGFVGEVSANGDQLSFFPLKDFLFNVRIGYINSGNILDDAKFSTLILGAGTRYKIGTIPVNLSFMKMNPLTIGSGIYYTSSKIQYTAPSQEKKTKPSEDGYFTNSRTEVDLHIDSYDVVLPVELITSLNILYTINFFFGTGVDLTFGSTSIDVKTDTEINAYQNDTIIETDTPARMELQNSKTESSSDYFRYKMIFGFGLKFGPVHIDIPLNYYPSSGLSASFVIGSSI